MEIEGLPEEIYFVVNDKYLDEPIKFEDKVEIILEYYKTNINLKWSLSDEQLRTIVIEDFFKQYMNRQQYRFEMRHYRKKMGLPKKEKKKNKKR